MSNPNKRKGDQFEWDLIALGEDPAGVLHEAGLTVERTRAGYERDEGDLHVLTPDRQRLATLQAKNRRERKWSEWLADTERQGVAARARFAALVVKRNGIGDVGRSYAITTVHAHLRLLATLHEAERERDDYRARLAKALDLDPGELADPPAPSAPVPAPALVPVPAARVRPFGPHGLVGAPQ
jgi:hypothetical protein